MIGEPADRYRSRRRHRRRHRAAVVAAGANVLVAGSAVFNGGGRPTPPISPRSGAASRPRAVRLKAHARPEARAYAACVGGAGGASFSPMSEGQAILVTGAARGIGRATVRLAAARGWSVGVNYLRDERAAHALVEEIARGGGKAVALRGDVADEDDVAAMFDGAARALGPLRGVVANAGIVAPAARLST